MTADEPSCGRLRSEGSDADHQTLEQLVSAALLDAARRTFAERLT